MLGKTSESEVSGKLYDLVYELNNLAPSLLLAVLPQLEFKLKVCVVKNSGQWKVFILSCVLAIALTVKLKGSVHGYSAQSLSHKSTNFLLRD